MLPKHDEMVNLDYTLDASVCYREYRSYARGAESREVSS
jgi:hypothetical protein